jgi:uncharacterized membrane protein
MTATFAPSPWPAPASPRRDDRWRFARLREAPAGWLFDLRRNVSITPRQLLAAYALLSVVSLGVAAGFWWQGAAVVLVFTGIELAGLAVALLVVARHAGDREIVTLTGRELAVEQRVGPGVLHTRFRTEWVRVEPVADDGSLVELSGEGRRVRIGRHLRPELRPELAQEIRRALRLARAVDRPQDTADRWPVSPAGGTAPAGTTLTAEHRTEDQDPQA